MDYWLERQRETQRRITDKNIREKKKELKAQYNKAFKGVLAQFESTYEKILETIEDGREPTPADLYKLDTYWSMQGELRDRLTKLGDKQAAALSKGFMKEYKEVYENFALTAEDSFKRFNEEKAKQTINSIWCADGKSWSQRVWGNTAELQERLNNSLIHCVLTGAKNRELKETLMNDFNVSYHRAEMIARTEIAHIQIEASKQRYTDYGIEKYQILVDVDSHTCKKCQEMDRKIFYLAELQAGVNAPPFHPNDRCDIMPVIEKQRNFFE